MIHPYGSTIASGVPFTARSGDETLTPDDAIRVLEEILEAQNQSEYLGLKLKIPEHEVTSIHKRYSDPKDCLYQVILKFLKQTEPRPTWRTIAAALRSPVVNLPKLAMKVEAAHIPDPIATRDTPPEATTSTGRWSHPSILHVNLNSY